MSETKPSTPAGTAEDTNPTQAIEAARAADPKPAKKGGVYFAPRYFAPRYFPAG